MDKFFEEFEEKDLEELNNDYLQESLHEIFQYEGVENAVLLLNYLSIAP